MSKLYTEEQVREAIKFAQISSNVFSTPLMYNKDDVIAKLTPIELPSDEEIEQSNPFRLGGGNYNSSAAHKWQKGVEWMRDKIQGGNNEQ